MKKTSDDFTSPEMYENILSSLKIDPNTADGFYLVYKGCMTGNFNTLDNEKTFAELKEEYDCKIVPSWSVNALLRVIEDKMSGKGIISYRPGRIIIKRGEFQVDEKNDSSINAIITALLKINMLCPKPL